ncbi:MAG TPA: methyltransferase, partial [Gemmatimonadales bacterium]|nr:methyltransferase [Gemmatimonadales bacterium]
RWVRHPIYTAMLGMCAGTALVSGEWHALVGWVVMALAYARKIRMEERSLRGVFGDSYDQYARRSWILIPGVF